MKSAVTQVALRTVLVYAVIAGVWILVSDRLLDWWVSDPVRLGEWQTLKGWLFVGTTAGLLYGVLRAQLARLAAEVDHRQRQAQEVARLSQLYATLSRINQGLMRVRSRPELFGEVCRIAGEHAGFGLVWIGALEAATSEIRVMAAAGRAAEGLDEIRGASDVRKEGAGPVAVCLREGRACVIEDCLTDPRTEPWREAARRHGVRSAAALPIRSLGGVQGALAVYADQAGFLRDKEMRLLEELAANVAYALEDLDREAHRMRAEQALRASEEQYRSLFANMLNGFAYCRVLYEAGRPVDFIFLAVNEAFESLTGLKDVEGRRVSDVVPTFLEKDTELLETYGRVARSGTPAKLEHHVRSLTTWFAVSVYSPGPEHFVAVFDVISERKRVEHREQLRREALERMARGEELTRVLDALVRLLEGDREEWRASVLLVDEARRRLVLGAAPRLPEPFRRALDGVQIERDSLTCAVAAATGEMVLSQDLERDPNWAPLREAAHRAGIRACWSRPIRSSTGTVIGTCALYGTEPRPPTPEELRDLSLTASLASVAIERRRAEEALSISEERLRLAAQAAQMGTWERDLRSDSVFWSAEMERLMGYEPGTFPGTDEAFLALLHPDSRAALVAAEERARATDGFLQAELHFVRRDGRERWGLMRGRILRASDGTPQRLIGVDIDITDRKRAEARTAAIGALGLQLSAAREPAAAAEAIARVALEFFPWDACFLELYDRATDVVTTLLTMDTIEGRRVPVTSELAGNRPTPMLRRVLEEGGQLILRGSGEEPPPGQRFGDVDRASQSLMLVPVRHQGGPIGVLSVQSYHPGAFAPADLRAFQDLADHCGGALARLQAEEQLRLMNLTLEQQVRERTAQWETANRELESFSYSVSHDLRAPLRAIHGFSEILVEDHGPRLGGEAQRILGQVNDQARRMGRLIEDLLAFSRTGRQPLRVREVELEPLIRSVFDECLAAAPRRRVQLTLEKLPPVLGDPAMLRQVLTNLVSNAVKYSRDRTPARITITGVRQADEVVIHIRDNGVGFDMRYVGKLFNVFQRLHGVDEFEGSGVGLAIVQRIIQRHGGRVWAEAKVDEGATFSFALPPAPAPDPA